VRYVVVVHGIGEQRKNETVLAVVDRFAEARRGLMEAQGALTLGAADSQTGKQRLAGGCRHPYPPNAFAPWLEFEAIPEQPADPASLPPFLGEAARSGDNLRFADMWWADVMQEDFPDVGQTAEIWTKGLLGRLQRKRPPPPAWTTAMLGRLEELIVLVRKLLALRAKELEETVFSRFLGDVQLYGEYAHCRGRAVRRFHRLIARIEAAHEAEWRERNPRRPYREEHKPHYTVIAHSLGSVMSMDALLYAHARLDLRRAVQAAGLGLPFPAYAAPSDLEKGDPKVPVFDTGWVTRVDSFVTLGSPIDKYLALWWLNYRYLNVPGRWMDPELAKLRTDPAHRIRHYNYADEQDPVGHNLDLAATAPAFRTVFATAEDRVFNRYAIPGAAHVRYWNDSELFAWILQEAVDGGGSRPAPRWFDPGIYRRALRINYLAPTLALAAALFFSASWGVWSRSWHGTVLAGALLVLAARIGLPLMRLMVWWRQIARLKWKCPEFAAQRRKAGRRFLQEVALLRPTLAAIAVLAFWACCARERWDLFTDVTKPLLFLLAAGVAALLPHRRTPGVSVTAIVFAAFGAFGLLALGRPGDAGGRWLFHLWLAATLLGALACHLHHLIHTAKRDLRANAQPDFPAYAGGEELEIPAPPPETK